PERRGRPGDGLERGALVLGLAAIALPPPDRQHEVDAGVVRHADKPEIVGPRAGPALRHLGDRAPGRAVGAEQPELELVAAVQGHSVAQGRICNLRVHWSVFRESTTKELTGGYEMRAANPFIRLLAGCAGLLLLVGAADAQIAGYPNKPVKIIVPFGAGGPTGVVARLIAQKLSEKLGQQFYIEDMTGAGGNIGMGAAARSSGDGYTILFVSSSYTVNPSLYAKLPFDAEKDLAPVTKAAGSPNGLFVHPSIPAKSVQELIDLLKANPGKYTFASPGVGTTPHLASELFKLTSGLDFARAPSPGGAPSIQSVVAGHTPICIQAIPPAMELVRAGKLRALGLTAKTRSPGLPDVPTFDELGIT